MRPRTVFALTLLVADVTAIAFAPDAPQLMCLGLKLSDMSLEGDAAAT